MAIPEGGLANYGRPRRCPPCGELVWPTERLAHMASHVEVVEPQVWKPGQNPLEVIYV